MKYIISDGVYKGKSVFAKIDIKINECIGEYYKDHPNKIYTKNIFGSFDRDLGRYCNHSFNPNTYVKESTHKDGYDLYALIDIKSGEEILVNYVDMEKIANVPNNTFYKSHFNENKQKLEFDKII